MAAVSVSDTQKRARVVEKNTFYFFDTAAEDINEGQIHSLREILAALKARVESCGSEAEKRGVFDAMLAERENGLRALLALTGFSNESLKRIITVSRIRDDRDFDRVIKKHEWLGKNDAFGADGREWSSDKIAKMVRENPAFRRGIVNLFFEGASVPFLAQTLPPFELRKFALGKLNFEPAEMLDTLVRYKEKGAFSAKSENNAEKVIAAAIESLGMDYEQGDLPKFVKNEPGGKRTMDFIVPNKRAPKVVIECSYLSTTSSGQGDKAKTERSISEMLRRHYPGCRFVGFLDGIGWVVRPGDLLRMVGAFDDVFTLHKDEMARFIQMLAAGGRR